MRRNRVSRSLKIVAVAVAVVLGVAQFASAQDGTVRIRYRGDITTLDPQMQSSLHDYGVADNIYSQLVKYEVGTSNIVPDLAESWEISEDGLTYTFHLRRGVQWHRGFGEVTSEDVKWTYDRIIAPDSRSPGRFDFSSIERIEAPDPYTVIFHLSAPHGPLLNKLAYNRNTGIVNRRALEQYGADYNFNAVGSGPFMLETWVPGQEIVLVANPDFYEEGVPRTQRIVLIPIADDAVAGGAMANGEVVLGLFRDPNTLAALEANPNLVVDRGQQSAISALYLRTDRPPFDDIRVRQAVQHAINKDELIADVLTGVATVAHTFITPLAKGSAADTVMRYAYDPALARQLLAEAGYPDGVSVDLLTTQLEPWPLVSPILQFYLEDIGFDIEFRQMEHGAYGQERNNSNYDMVVLTITGPPDPDTWMGVVHSSDTPPGFNSSYYANPEVDALVEQATSTVDEEERAALYRQIQEIVLQDTPFVPLYHLGVQVVRHPSVRGFPVPLAHDFPLKYLEIVND
jgi:peptide/nickel transport system substrate-binding protein